MIVIGNYDCGFEPPEDTMSGIKAFEFIGIGGVDHFCKSNSGLCLEVKFWTFIEVMDALTISNLKKKNFCMRKKIKGDLREKLGQEESDDTLRHRILFDTGSEISCNYIDFRREDLRDPREQVSDEKHQESIASQEEALPLPVEKRDFHRRAQEQLHKASCRPSYCG